MSIFYSGNTYLFGATIGSGVTSYVFPGLSAGSTYNFIMWAFNSGGTSNIEGPILCYTPLTEESRNLIGAFSWMWDGNDYPTTQYYTGSTLNIIRDSETISSQWWGGGQYTNTSSGITLPNGYTSGRILGVSGGYKNLYQNPYLEGGQTYVFSFYMHPTLGNTGMRFMLYYQTGVCIPPRRQILPQVGAWGTGSYATTLLGPTSGETGWVRYAIEFYTNFGAGTRYYLPFQTENVAAGRTYYIGAPQLEKST